MLNEAHRKQYQEKGWVVVEGIFERAAAQGLAEFASRFAWERAVASGERYPGYNMDVADDGRQAPRKIDHPFLQHERFREFARDERLLAALRELVGAEPLLATDQIFLKPPQFGSAKPYH